jgi:hypothetical protein
MHFLIILSYHFAGAFVFSAFGMTISAGAKDMPTANMVLTALRLPMIFISGVFVPTQSLPPQLRIVSYLTPLTYAVDALREATIGPTVMFAVDLVSVDMVHRFSNYCSHRIGEDYDVKGVSIQSDDNAVTFRIEFPEYDPARLRRLAYKLSEGNYITVSELMEPNKAGFRSQEDMEKLLSRADALQTKGKCSQGRLRLNQTPEVFQPQRNVSAIAR